MIERMRTRQALRINLSPLATHSLEPGATAHGIGRAERPALDEEPQVRGAAGASAKEHPSVRMLKFARGSPSCPTPMDRRTG